MKRHYIYVFLIAIGMVWLPDAAQAAAKPAKLTADEVRYNESRQIEALGHVSIIYDGATIKADYALIDQELDVVIATGEVHLDQEGDSFQGDRLLYYFKDKQGWLAPVNCEITDSEIHGKVYLTSKEAFLKGEDIIVKGSGLTSCDLEHPHYHFSAAEVEYYPGERIILHKVWYWEGKFKLLYFPKLSISLKEDENNLETPVIGYNDTEGWFLRWGYNYFLNSNSYGRVYLEDITERYGDGIGIKHYIKPTPTSRWYQDYYYQDREDMGYPKDDFKVGFGYENWRNSKLKYATSIEDWHRFSEAGEHYSDMTYRLSLTGQTPYPTVTLKFSETGLSPQRDVDAYTSWNYHSDNSFNIRTTARWQLDQYLQEDYEYQNHYYYINAVKSWKNSSLQFDLQTTRSMVQQNFLYSNLLPEITYKIPKLDLPWLGEVNSSFQYTRLEKVNVTDGVSTVNNGTRWASDLSKTQNLWENKNQKLRLNLDSKFRYRYFEVDEEDSDITALTESVNLGYNFTKNLSTSFGLGYTGKSGPDNDTDFFSKGDNFLPGGFISSNWAWKSEIFSASLSTGYSFYTQAPQTVYFSSSITPGERQQFEFSTAYDWGDGLGQTNLDVNYNPRENWKLKLGLGYDFQNTWTKKEFQSFVTQPISKNWKMEFNSIYDSLQDELSIANVALVYDWHCREVKFYYDHVNREYWIQLIFKAFPNNGFKLSPNPEDYLYWIDN